jgi:ABC-2 type transport system permease protein
MNQLSKLFIAHLKMTFREKQVWFWSIFYPVFLMVIFLTIFGGFGSDNDKGLSAEIAVVVGAESEISGQIASILKGIPVLEWRSEDPVTREKAEEWLKDKEIDGFIILPDGNSSKQLELVVNRENEQSTTTQVLTGILREAAGSIDRTSAPAYTFQVGYLSSGSDDLKYSDFLLTGMIALSISQAGLFGMVSMVEMRRNGLLKRLKMTPVNMKLFGLGEIFVRFILSAVQVMLLSSIGMLFYHAEFHFNIGAFLIMFFIGTIVFAAIGYMIAAFAKSMESFMGIVNLVSFLMMFLSGVFFDMNALPSWLVPVANFLPLTYFVNGIRDSMVYGLGIIDSDFWLNTSVLLAWTVATFAIGARFYKWKPESR